MGYKVLNLDTDESHGIFDTLDEARGCVRFDRISDRYEIQHVDLDGNLLGRVQFCDDYLYLGSTDHRVLQGVGLPNGSEREC